MNIRGTSKATSHTGKKLWDPETLMWRERKVYLNKTIVAKRCKGDHSRENSKQEDQLPECCGSPAPTCDEDLFQEWELSSMRAARASGALGLGSGDWESVREHGARQSVARSPPSAFRVQRAHKLLGLFPCILCLHFNLSPDPSRHLPCWWLKVIAAIPDGLKYVIVTCVELILGKPCLKVLYILLYEVGTLLSFPFCR